MRGGPSGAERGNKLSSIVTEGREVQSSCDRGSFHCHADHLFHLAGRAAAGVQPCLPVPHVTIIELAGCHAYWSYPWLLYDCLFTWAIASFT